MNKQDAVRKKLIKAVEEHGIVVKFIARKLGWDYPTMIKFKNGQDTYSQERIEAFDNFLSRYN
jgi:hypothetical protein